MKKTIISLIVLGMIIVPSFSFAKSKAETEIDAFNIRTSFNLAIGDIKSILADIPILIARLRFYQAYGDTYNEGSGNSNVVNQSNTPVSNGCMNCQLERVAD